MECFCVFRYSVLMSKSWYSCSARVIFRYISRTWPSIVLSIFLYFFSTNYYSKKKINSILFGLYGLLYRMFDKNIMRFCNRLLRMEPSTLDQVRELNSRCKLLNRMSNLSLIWSCNLGILLGAFLLVHRLLVIFFLLLRQDSESSMHCSFVYSGRVIL